MSALDCRKTDLSTEVGGAAAGTWCIVLAAGDGTRLQSLTTFAGRNVPKQFCTIGTEVSLLGLAIRRARRLVPEERIVAIVAAAHRCWWHDELADLPARQVVVQPENRGTAAGILLPLLRILDRDPAASIVLLPADHYVEDEWQMATAAHAAVAALRRDPERLVLLGARLERPDSGLGWIAPRRCEDPLVPVPVPVERFREKPSSAELTKLVACGAAVNTFVVAARGAALLAAFEHTQPDLLWRFRRADAGRAGPARLRELYADLPTVDFSRDVLEPMTDRLAVLRVPDCGWNDLGTPERVAASLPGRPVRPPASLYRRRAPVLGPRPRYASSATG